MLTVSLRIMDGMIYDGLGSPGVSSNVYVLDDRIVDVTREKLPATETIDAHGLAVSPGFIDTHSHSDLQIFSEPRAEAKITQGITTEIVGQDGFSVAPIDPAMRVELARYLSGLAGELDEWNWLNLNAYLERIAEASPATNIASLVGNGTLRAAAIGFENRKATPDQLEEMKVKVAQAMEQGALGLSSGLIYPPSLYADERELIELCKTVAEHGGVYVTHMRDEANRLLDSLGEAIRVAEGSKSRLHISHHKAIGRANWGTTRTSLEMIDQASRRGLEISCDVYPYTAGSTMLTAVLPPWALDGGPEALHRRLADPAERQHMRRDIETDLPGWVSYSKRVGWDKIVVTYSKSRRDVEGKSIQEIAKTQNKSEADVVLDLLLEARSAVSMLAFHISEDDVRRVVKHGSSMICTDGLLGGKPHPRAYGAFPRVLRRYVREERWLTLESAIRKMTSLPSSRFRLKDRGQIMKGAFADIVVFDPKTISDQSTYENPRQFSTGIEYVIVNGQITLNEGRQTEKRAGRPIKRDSE